MNRVSLRGIAITFLAAFAGAHAAASDLDQNLRDRYEGKIFLLRGFYSNDRLRYDSKGLALRDERSGDWTSDGFVAITEIHESRNKLKIKARRMIVISVGQMFQLQIAEDQRIPEPDKKAVFVEIESDLGADEPSSTAVDAVMSKIFLTAQNTLEDMVPAYWKPCVHRGLIGVDENCHFSQEMLTIPGVVPSGSSNATPASTEPGSGSLPIGSIFRVGKDVLPPKVVSSPEPEFSKRARAAKYQGTTTLGLIVNTEGIPTHILILKPLGGGLDSQAVHAVEGWKFKPAEKDGHPVAVEIAVEVDFHLY